MSGTTPMQSTKSNPYHAGYDQDNLPGDNPPAYQPADLNPHHVGYDQNNTNVYGQNAAPPPQPQNAIAVQPSVMAVNIQQQPQALIVSPARGSDLTLPSILVCFFCCWCTGFPAIIYAMMAQNRYGEGNWQEGENCQRKARTLMVTSVVLHFAIWVVFLILYFTVIGVSVSTYDNNY